MKISEAQVWVGNVLRKHRIKKIPLASLVGIYEELGELSSVILQKEGFKKRARQPNIGYKTAEVFFELLKLAVEYNIDLENEFVKAQTQWTESEPLWM